MTLEENIKKHNVRKADADNPIYEIKGLTISVNHEPVKYLRTPEGLSIRDMYELLNDENVKRYDSWCRHKD